jgi:hypothetical protein
MNEPTLKPTEFTDTRTGEKYYGFRLYDEYDKYYSTEMDSIPDDDMVLLAEVNRIISEDENETNPGLNILDRSCNDGLWISHHFYNSKQVREVIDTI